jgi:hypothetical protein
MNVFDRFGYKPVVDRGDSTGGPILLLFSYAQQVQPHVQFTPGQLSPQVQKEQVHAALLQFELLLFFFMFWFLLMNQLMMPQSYSDTAAGALQNEGLYLYNSGAH